MCCHSISAIDHASIDGAVPYGCPTFVQLSNWTKVEINFTMTDILL